MRNKSTPKTALMKFSLLFAALGLANPTSASAAYEGCSSAPILEGFKQFGKTKKMPPALGKWLSNSEMQAIEPWQAFDNVTFVGICWVSAWLIETKDGYVLLDTLYGPFTDGLITKLETAGVPFAEVKYVLMTHGHFDHAGGASKLKKLLPNAKFVMSKAGWDEAITSAKGSTGSRREWSMIEPDVVVKDGDSLVLGGNTFKVHETPGHTWGTTSYSYDAYDNGNAYRAITIGGLGLNAIEGPSQVEAYINSVDAIIQTVETKQIEADHRVQIHLPTHGFAAQLEENRIKHLNRKEGEANRFIDPDAFLSDLQSLRADAVERLSVEKSKTSSSANSAHPEH